jgi:hypothetical protein
LYVFNGFLDDHMDLIVSVGQSTLPSTCPVCEHNPVAGSDSKPNKSLRTTIKVFLRTEEKKREALRLKEEKNTPPDTPLIIEATPVAPAEPVAPSEETPIASNDAKDVADGKDDVSQVPVTEEGPDATSSVLHSDIQQTEQAQQDIPQPSIEVSSQKKSMRASLTSE